MLLSSILFRLECVLFYQFYAKILVTTFVLIKKCSVRLLSHTLTSKSLAETDVKMTSNPENAVECFVPSYAISDHFLVCFIRKMNGLVAKTEHISTSYRCYKHFNESLFLSDVGSDLEKKLIKRSRVCHSHKRQLTFDIMRKRKRTKTYTRKTTNKCTRNTKTSSLFPKRGGQNAKTNGAMRTKRL